MAIMAPEVVGAAGAATAGVAGEAGKRLAGGNRGSDLGGYGDDGAPIAFMLAVVLLGLGMMALWLAFHNPAEWDTSSGEFPGLAGRIVQWMQRQAGKPGILGDLNPSQPPATRAAEAVSAAAGILGGEQQQPANPLSKAGIIQDIKNAFNTLVQGIIPGSGDVLSKTGL